MVDHGIVLVNKEKGYTSHDVAAVARKIFQRVKTGHTGTLDPQAEGVLPICLGRATKLAGLLTADDKSYIAEVVLGITTDTYDTSGQELTRRPVIFDASRINEVAASFVGGQDQMPPMYSAIKVNGKKLYELARAGKTVERAARRVFIERIDIVDFNEAGNAFTIAVSCSKGTYIRSLCHDIGAALGCGACMGALTRTRSGMFEIKDAVTLAALKEAPDNYVWPVDKALPYSRAFVQEDAHKRAINGNPIPIDFIDFPQKTGEKYWLYSREVLIGLYKHDKERFMPEVMMV